MAIKLQLLAIISLVALSGFGFAPLDMELLNKDERQKYLSFDDPIFPIAVFNDTIEISEYNKPTQQRRLLISDRCYYCPVYGCISPDRKLFAISNNSNEIRLGNEEYSLTLKHSFNVSAMNFSSDSQRFLSTSYDQTAKVWNVKDGKLLFTLIGHKGWIFTGEISPNQKQIVTLSGDRTGKVWDGQNGTLLYDLPWNFSWNGLHHVARFSPDSEQIVTVVDSNVAKVWRAEDGKHLFDLVLPLPLENDSTTDISSIRFSPDSELIAISSNRRTFDSCQIWFTIWNAKTGILLSSSPWSHDVGSMLFTSDGKRLATFNFKGKAKQWLMPPKELLLPSNDERASYVKIVKGFLKVNNTRNYNEFLDYFHFHLNQKEEDIFSSFDADSRNYLNILIPGRTK